MLPAFRRAEPDPASIPLLHPSPALLKGLGLPFALLRLDQGGPATGGSHIVLCGDKPSKSRPGGATLHTQLDMNPVTQTMSPLRKNGEDPWGGSLGRRSRKTSLRTGLSKPTRRGGSRLPLLCKQSRGRTDRRHQGFRRERLGFTPLCPA